MLQEKEPKTPVSVKSVKKEVAAIANDVATPVVEAVIKRVRKQLQHPASVTQLACTRMLAVVRRKLHQHKICCSIQFELRWVRRK